MAGNSGDPGRTVASKVAVILAAFTAGAEHTLSQLAHQTSLPVSTVHRLLRDLVAAELLDRCGDGRYRAAWALRTLEVDPVEPTLAERAPSVADDLAAALQTTARVGVLDALEISYVEKVPGLVCGTSFPNTARLPLHATALGKALLAFLRPVVVRLVIAQGLSSYTPHTVIRADQLQYALQQARMRGFAISAGELDVGCAIAVPVFDAAGGLIAGVEVQVDDLAAPTLARVLPSLLLAARGLGRNSPRGDGAHSAVRRSGPTYLHRLASGRANRFPSISRPGTAREPGRPPRSAQRCRNTACNSVTADRMWVDLVKLGYGTLRRFDDQPHTADSSSCCAP